MYFINDINIQLIILRMQWFFFGFSLLESLKILEPPLFRGRYRGQGVLGAEAPSFTFRLYLINMLRIIMKFVLA